MNNDLRASTAHTDGHRHVDLVTLTFDLLTLSFGLYLFSSCELLVSIFELMAGAEHRPTGIRMTRCNP